MSALIRMGLPIAAKTFFINGSFLFVGAQINALGVLAVAVTGISQKVQHVMNIIGMAMNDGTATMVGQNFAAGQTNRVRRTVWCATSLGLCFCAVLCVFFLTVPKAIFGLLTDDPEVIALAPAFMRICCLSIFSFALMSPTIGLINGVGNTSLNLVISIMDGVVGRIVLSLWLGKILGLGALGFFLGNTLAGFITVIWGDLYFLSGRWEKRTVLLAGEEA